MKHIFCFLFVISIIACKEKPTSSSANEVSIAADNFEKDLQSKLIDAVEGSVLYCPKENLT